MYLTVNEFILKEGRKPAWVLPEGHWERREDALLPSVGERARRRAYAEIKDMGRGREARRGDRERRLEKRGERKKGSCRRDRESCLNDDIMFFHLPHLEQATQGLVFIWIRMLPNLVFVCLPL